MVSPPVPGWGAVILALLLVGTTYTDLRWRRIPNVLTFPVFGLALVLSGLASGWEGLLLSLSGALLSPCLVSLMHGGRGPGMGDLKLAATVGAFLGPVMGTVAMLLSMIVGGVVALVWAMNEWGTFGRGRINEFIGRVYFLGRRPPLPGEDASPSTIPYGVALAVGTLLTLVVCQCTGKQDFLSYVNHAAMP